MPLTLDQFRRAQDAQPGHLPADIVASVVTCFEEYLRGAAAGVTMDRAFATVGPSGGDPWHLRLSRERRNAAYCDLASVLRPGGEATEKADAVLREQRRVRRATSHPSPVQTYMDVIIRESIQCGLIENPETLRKIISCQVYEKITEPAAFKKPARMPR